MYRPICPLCRSAADLHTYGCSMTHSNAIWYQLKPYAAAFRTHAKLWILPTLALTAGAIVYALIMPATWRASQLIEVRDEVIGNQNGKANFDSVDWMKVYQEKVLEVAKSRVVAEAVLIKVGPPSSHPDNLPWPTENDIVDMQGEISITAPKGSEFGRTKTITLAVTGESPKAALARCHAAWEELEKNLGMLRNASAQSVIVELEGARALAQADLDAATTKIEELEREVGADLGELRSLTEHSSGEGTLRGTLTNIKAELRAVERIRESQEQLKELLEKSNQDTLLATPSRLLESQPGLKSLKDGLSALLLDLSKLRGQMSESHPKVQQAMRAEQQIRHQLQIEVATALRGIEADLESNAAQIESMKRQQLEVQERLDKLASMRARYTNLVADGKQRTQTLDNIKQKLAEAHAAKSAATSSSLLTRFGDPVVGDRPISPSKKTVVAAGLAAGMTLGVGLVLLFMPTGPIGGARRWSDILNLGRRATDQLFRRRATDAGSSQAPPVGATTAQGAVNGARRSGDAPPAAQSTYPDVDRRTRTERRAGTDKGTQQSNGSSSS